MTAVPPSMFGIPALRTEDPRFLRGEGRYLDNIAIGGAVRATFARSIVPHAELREVGGVAEAAAMPGVLGVWTAEGLDLAPIPPSGNVETSLEESLEAPFVREVLVRDRVRYVGEPFAVVVAETAAQAADAAESIWADAEPLSPLLDPEAADAADAPLLWPDIGTNVAHRFEHDWDEDVLAGAEVVVRGRVVNQRLAPVPMETNGIAVVPGDDGLTVWVSTQIPFDVRDEIADRLGLERDRVRVIAPDVGGAFGAKLQIYPEYLAVARVAQVVGRPVRWTETRSESMTNLTHGRAQVQTFELGARRDGTLVGLRADIVADVGAYPLAAFIPTTTGTMLSGVYRIPRIAYRGRAVVTNTTPIGPYRGAGRPEAAALIERAIDALATELDADPVELRRRNMIEPAAFPFRTATRMKYDTGEYERALDEAVRRADLPALRAERSARRARGDHMALGIGISTYVEITSFSSREFAEVRVEDDGRVTVLSGLSPHGQGHETSLAQIASAAFGVPIETVRVVHSDTAEVAQGEGTWGSRSLQAGGSAVWERSSEVVERARRIAAHLLEVDEADLEGPVDGGFRVAGVPDRAVGWADLARAAADPERLPTDAETGPLAAKGVFRERGSTFPFGTHVAIVEVDTETGRVELLRIVAVDDCGRILNPVLVRGQQHGGMAQGIAQALYEEVVFDAAGNPSNANLSTYLVPSAAELPWLETSTTETPTDANPLGAKGIGESGSIGSTPAVQAAVIDALSHLGVRHVDMPCTPERVWRAIRTAATG